MPRRKEVQLENLEGSSLRRELEKFLMEEKTWPEQLKKLKEKISHQVREKYQYKIEQEIESGVWGWKMDGEKRMEEKKRALRERIFQGESSGDRYLDLYFAWQGRLDEAEIAKFRLIGQAIENALNQEETPLFLEYHFNNGELRTLNLLRLRLPGLCLEKMPFTEYYPPAHYWLKIATQGDIYYSPGFAGFSPRIEKSLFLDCTLLEHLDFQTFIAGKSMEEVRALSSSDKKLVWSLWTGGLERFRKFGQGNQEWESLILQMCDFLLSSGPEIMVELRNKENHP